MHTHSIIIIIVIEWNWDCRCAVRALYATLIHSNLLGFVSDEPHCHAAARIYHRWTPGKQPSQRVILLMTMTFDWKREHKERPQWCEGNNWIKCSRAIIIMTCVQAHRCFATRRAFAEVISEHKSSCLTSDFTVLSGTQILFRNGADLVRDIQPRRQ